MREPVRKIDMVNMSVTNKCNLKCPSCPTGSLSGNLARNGKSAVVELPRRPDPEFAGRADHTKDAP